MDKYKLITMQDDLSSQEIESLKDFKQVLSTYKSTVWLKLFYKWLGAIVLSASVSGIVLWQYNSSTPSTNNYEYSSSSLNSNIPDASISSLPEIETRVLPEDSLGSRSSDLANLNRGNPPLVSKKPDPALNDQVSFSKAEPSYSLDSMVTLMNDEIRSVAKSRGSGTVSVAFKVTEQGNIQEVKIIKGFSAEYDSVILKFIEALPVWNPATVNGIPRASTVSLPININIEPNN